MPGAYNRMSQLWRKNLKEIMKKKLVELRKENVVVRVDKPSRIDKARRLGYKAKRGYVIVRVRVRRGGRRRRLYGRRGRKPSKAGLVRFTSQKSLRKIAEEKAMRKFPNLKVINSYYLAEDGRYKWFEVILIDPKIVEE